MTTTLKQPTEVTLTVRKNRGAMQFRLTIREVRANADEVELEYFAVTREGVAAAARCSGYDLNGWL